MVELAVGIDAPPGLLAVLAVNGIVDEITAPLLADALGILRRGGRHRIALDLGGARFAGPAGGAVLIRERARMQADGGFVWLISPGPRPLPAAGLDAESPVFASVPDARKYFASIAN
ncbi:MAG: STAS domain-containing protein [Nocardiopsaceae bacterium]|nr:STAS domain-containing protein [Nocardiopsaceae bacterium]